MDRCSVGRGRAGEALRRDADGRRAAGAIAIPSRLPKGSAALRGRHAAAMPAREVRLHELVPGSMRMDEELDWIQRRRGGR